jgi:hypothetical protein
MCEDRDARSQSAGVSGLRGNRLRLTTLRRGFLAPTPKASHTANYVSICCEVQIVADDWLEILCRSVLWVFVTPINRATVFTVFPAHRTLLFSFCDRLLAETDMSITEIALSCGYRNISNFNRQFLDLRQISPREFRCRMRSPR